MSLSVIGSLGKTVTYTDAAELGSVARAYTIPRNPRSASQIQVRQCMAWASKLWNHLSADEQFPWGDLKPPYLKQNPFLYRGAQVQQLKTASDLEGYVFTTRRNGGIDAQSLIVTPGPGQLTLTLPAISLPANFIALFYGFFLVVDQDPHGDPNPETYVTYAAAPQHTVVFPGLTSGQRYRCGGAYFAFTPAVNNDNCGASASAWGTPT